MTDFLCIYKVIGKLIIRKYDWLKMKLGTSFFFCIIKIAAAISLLKSSSENSTVITEADDLGTAEINVTIFHSKLNFGIY